MSNSSNQKTYDLKTTGFGYLNRIRYVFPNQGDRYLAINVVLLEGVLVNEDYSKLNKTSYDARIVGNAIDDIQTHFEFDDKGFAILPKDTLVVATVRIGGCNPVIYQITKDGKAENRVSLRTRLYHFDWLKIGDNVVIQTTSNALRQNASSETTPSESAEEHRPQEASQDDSNAARLSASADVSVNAQSSSSVLTKVTLDQGDPNFVEKLADLQQRGFKWNARDNCWEGQVTQSQK